MEKETYMLNCDENYMLNVIVISVIFINVWILLCCILWW